MNVMGYRYHRMPSLVERMLTFGLLLVHLPMTSVGLRAPVAPPLPGYPHRRFLGLLPTFRQDACGCIEAHAAYCRQLGLSAVAMPMGVLGTFTLIVGNEELTALFEDRDNIYFKSAIDRRGVGLLTGIGVLLADGSQHTRQRRLVVPSFEFRRLARYVETMNTVAQDLAETLVQVADDAAPAEGTAAFPVAATMSTAALRIVGMCLFSSDPATASGTTAAFGCALEACLEHTAWVSRSALPPPNWLPTPRNRRFRRQLRVLDSFVYGLIDERRAARRAQTARDEALSGVAANGRGEGTLSGNGGSDAGCDGGSDGGSGSSGSGDGDGVDGGGGDEGGDLLDMLLTAEAVPAAEQSTAVKPSSRRARSWWRWRQRGVAHGAPPAGLRPHEVRDEAMTLLLAGHETSALALTWCLHFLSSAEMVHWQDAIAAEGCTLLKQGVTPATLEATLPRTRAALSEALRLRPPAWAFDREVQRAVTLPGGLELRRREIVLLSPYAQHLDPDTFPAPHCYDPSRFLREGEGEGVVVGDAWDGGYAKYEYFPFGNGRRRCIGYRFARWEMLILLATLLARVHVMRPPGYVAPQLDGSVTLRPAQDFELLIRRRTTPRL